ncbi:MAG: Trypsin-like peptidase domain [Pseudomonadota bacterium]|jgi:hypothetical protein
MKHVYLFGLVGVGLLGCGGGDPHEPELSTREATGDECAAGGTVLQLNGDDKVTVCNGANGQNGQNGAQGAPGVVGSSGEKGDTGARGATGSTGANGDPGASGQPGAAGQAGPAGASTAAEVAETISCISGQKASLVGIQCTDGVTYGFGSGTVTQGGQVITAQHVVADIATQTCSVFDIDVDHATMIGTVLDAVPDAVFDLAVLNVSWVDAAPAGIAVVSARPALGEMVVSTGHPAALLALQYSSGFVTAVALTEMGPAWSGAFMADYSSSGGGSGGAIFNANCEWIGIHVGGFSNGLESSIALPF